MADQTFNRTPGKTSRARRLRFLATPAERRLWLMLRGGQMEGESFRRQRPAGPYVLDFYCARLRLAIEVDGIGHGYYYSVQRDARRDAWLSDNGVLVLRFSNPDVRSNPLGVGETIRLAVIERARRITGPVSQWKAPFSQSTKLTASKA
jgi:very-short-patch-repair endonuclease